MLGRQRSIWAALQCYYCQTCVMSSLAAFACACVHSWSGSFSFLFFFVDWVAFLISNWVLGQDFHFLLYMTQHVCGEPTVWWPRVLRGILYFCWHYSSSMNIMSIRSCYSRFPSTNRVDANATHIWSMRTVPFMSWLLISKLLSPIFKSHC